MFQMPDRHAIEDQVKAAAIERVARLGGDDGIVALQRVLESSGSDAGRISAMLANSAITDAQAQKLVVALDKLSAGGTFPPAFAERMKVPRSLPMTTGLAATASPVPRIAQAAVYELHATAAIENNRKFPFPFVKSEIASFHYRFQHNRYGSMSEKRSYEGDIVIQHKMPLAPPITTFIDFKHSHIGKPEVSRDEMERIFRGLSRGEIDRAVIVSNSALKSAAPITEVNKRINALNEQGGDNIPFVQIFVQPW
jgi:hypothetical protein